MRELVCSGCGDPTTYAGWTITTPQGLLCRECQQAREVVDYVKSKVKESYLDRFAKDMYNVVRTPGESDASLRMRCLHLLEKK